MILSLNGIIIDEKVATIPLTSELFLFGHGVFETLRTYNQKIFRLADHLKRLHVSASAMMIESEWSAEKIKAEILKTLSHYQGQKELKIRVILSQQDLIIMLEELEEKPITFYEKGIECVYFLGERSMPEVKKMGDSFSFLAKKHAAVHDAYESILVDKQRYVRECAYANIFWVKNGTVYTTNKDILFGITREVVLELIDEPRFAETTLPELLKADEIFITQSTSGILPVVKVDGQKIGDGKVGEVTKGLMERFFAYCHSSESGNLLS